MRGRPPGRPREILHFLYQEPGHTLTEHFVNYLDTRPDGFTGFCFTAMAERSFQSAHVVEWLALDQGRARQSPASAKFDILFTGFEDAERAVLEARATAAGYRVRTSVTKGLAYLCCGPNAGPVKMRKAREVGAEFLNKNAFEGLITHGELPLNPPP